MFEWQDQQELVINVFMKENTINVNVNKTS